MNSPSNIAVLYTGGTIGMVPSEEGLVPSASFESDCHNELGDQFCARTFVSLSPLLDSSAMKPKQWHDIAQTVRELAQSHSAVIVLHGTDTMAFTASALGFLLVGCTIPVVLTGSQLPLLATNSDAHANIRGAFQTVSALQGEKNGGVWLHFAGKTLLGCRSSKISASNFEGFGAPKLSADLSADETNAAAGNGFSDCANRVWSKTSVATLRWVPGGVWPQLKALSEAPPQGLLLELYGAGTLALDDREWAGLVQLANAGCVITAVTQCAHGRVNFDTYQASAALKKIGLLAGADLTFEAAFSKLYCLLALGFSSDEVKQWWPINCCGELTPDTQKPLV